jgi:hypothetical protein
MLEFTVDVDVAGIDRLLKDIQDAQSNAIREVARMIILPPAQDALSYSGARPSPLGVLGVVTGRTRAQLKAKFWKTREGLINGSVRVIGDRAHIARFGEKGTKRQPARRMFEIVGQAIRINIERGLVSLFERNMKLKGYR